MHHHMWAQHRKDIETEQKSLNRSPSDLPLAQAAREGKSYTGGGRGKN